MPGDPLGQEEALTLEAELRQALQHRRAAQEQAQETREELARLLARARAILGQAGAAERGGSREPGIAADPPPAPEETGAEE